MTRSLHISVPEPGYYRRRLVKGGPYVGVLVFRPCRIEFEPETFQAVDRWPQLQCLVDGKPANLMANWCFLEPITMAEYLYLMSAAAWDRLCDPNSPAANPFRPVRLGELDPILPPGTRSAQHV